MLFDKNVALSNLSTFGIGGLAKYYYEATSAAEMASAIRFADAHAIPHLVIGAGSNCLFSDDGYEGLIIRNRIDFFDFHDGICTIGGGHSIASAAVKTAKEGWGGLEFAAGIPGTVGGAVVMNAGCLGKETFDSLVFVEVLDESGECKKIWKAELEHGYRTTALQKSRAVVLSAAFQMHEDTNAYAVQREMLAHRRKTQPLQERSAGCVFRNPPNASAGQLIDKAGLKSTRIGDAMIAPIHANFIVNVGRATAGEVRSLITLVQERVCKSFGIDLHTEICVF